MAARSAPSPLGEPARAVGSLRQLGQRSLEISIAHPRLRAPAHSAGPGWHRPIHPRNGAFSSASAGARSRDGAAGPSGVSEPPVVTDSQGSLWRQCRSEPLSAVRDPAAALPCSSRRGAPERGDLPSIHGWARRAAPQADGAGSGPRASGLDDRSDGPQAQGKARSSAIARSGHVRPT
jgi:hypothetical protein